MKKLLFALFAVSAFVLNAADVGLLKFVPAKFEVLALANVPRLLAHPDAQKQLADPEAVKQLAALKELGLDIAALKAVMVFYADDEVGVAVRLESAAKLRDELDKSITASDGTSVAARQVNGRRIYRLSSKKRSEELDMIFVAEDVVVVAEPEALEKYFASARVSAETVAKIQIPDVALWAMWRDLNPKKAADKDDIGLLSVMATMDFSGAEGHDLDLAAVGVFRNAKAAARMGMMVPGYVSMGVGMAFSEDPQTGEDIIKALKCETQGNQLRLSMHLSAELIRRITVAAEAAAKDALSGPKDANEQSAPAPADPAAPAPAAK